MSTIWVGLGLGRVKTSVAGNWVQKFRDGLGCVSKAVRTCTCVVTCVESRDTCVDVSRVCVCVGTVPVRGRVSMNSTALTSKSCRWSHSRSPPFRRPNSSGYDAGLRRRRTISRRQDRHVPRTNGDHKEMIKMITVQWPICSPAGQHVLAGTPAEDWRILLEWIFTTRTCLFFTASSIFGLGRRCYRLELS